jgi:peptidoglycan/xylan/chitin deacetylase (PgdA/CDA1 family)
MLDKKKIIKTLMGRIAGLSGAYERAFASGMMVVAFHRVNDELATDPLTCSSAQFGAFCRFFRKHARVVPLSEQVAAFHAGTDMRGTVAITFDDGYRDNFEVAAPILRSLGLPATFFITSGFVGSQVTAPWDVELPCHPGWMSWDDVRSLVAHGFEIGCHTVSHIDMGTADRETVRKELEVSRERINRELGISVQLFAYPFGDPENITDSSRDLVRELGFSCCASCYGGVNAVDTNPYQLRRIPIAQWFATPHQFGFEFLIGMRRRDGLWADPEPSRASAPA